MNNEKREKREWAIAVGAGAVVLVAQGLIDC